MSGHPGDNHTPEEHILPARPWAEVGWGVQPCLVCRRAVWDADDWVAIGPAGQIDARTKNLYDPSSKVATWPRCHEACRLRQLGPCKGEPCSDFFVRGLCRKGDAQCSRCHCGRHTKPDKFSPRACQRVRRRKQREREEREECLRALLGCDATCAPPDTPPPLCRLRCIMDLAYELDSHPRLASLEISLSSQVLDMLYRGVGELDIERLLDVSELIVTV